MEKFHDWADIHESLTDDDVITLVMMHWIQGATPGLRFYRQAFGSERREAEKTFETYVAAPTGVSMYAKEQLHVSTTSRSIKPSAVLTLMSFSAPRDWAQQAANVRYWKEYERGGHFSSLECPEIFVKDMRDFFGSIAL